MKVVQPFARVAEVKDSVPERKVETCRDMLGAGPPPGYSDAPRAGARRAGSTTVAREVPEGGPS